MADTDILNVSMKERFFLSTTPFKLDQTVEPGKTLRIVADPLGSMLHIEEKKDEKGQPVYNIQASPLAVTASRFRDFLYVGSTFTIVPAANNAQVDPAHVNDNGAGSSNYLHPIDMSSTLHYRRWLGGDFDVPHGTPTGANSTYTEQDSLKLDDLWLNDSRFNHVPITEGFGFDSVPMETDLVTNPLAANSVFAYFQTSSGSAASGLREQPWEQPMGALAIRGSELKRRLWMPNPFAGFVYTPRSSDDSTYRPEAPKYNVTELNRFFPWFGDLTELMTPPSMKNIVFDVLHMVHNSLLNPLCILRLPPSYGSRFFWTGYMRHEFAFRHPYLLDGTWTAGKIEGLKYDPSDLHLQTVDSDGYTHLNYTIDESPECLHGGILHTAPTDPYASDNEIFRISMRDEDASLAAKFRDEPKKSVQEMLDYIRGYVDSKKELSRKSPVDDSTGSAVNENGNSDV